MTGMTPIVRNVTSLVAAFAMIYAVYATVSGHVSPGGGFAGGVVAMAAVVLMLLAFGARRRTHAVAQDRCRVISGAAALGFVSVAAGGFLASGWFVNFVPKAHHEMLASGTILISDVFIALMVAAGLVGVFLAVVAGAWQSACEGELPAE